MCYNYGNCRCCFLCLSKQRLPPVHARASNCFCKEKWHWRCQPCSTKPNNHPSMITRSWIHWCRFFNDCETSYCSGTPDALVLKQEQVVAMDGQEEIVLWRRGNGNCNGSWCWTSSNPAVLGWHNIFGYTHEGVMYVQTYVCICSMYVMYVCHVCVCVYTQWYATCNMYHKPQGIHIPMVHGTHIYMLYV